MNATRNAHALRSAQAAFDNATPPTESPQFLMLEKLTDQLDRGDPEILERFLDRLEFEDFRHIARRLAGDVIKAKLNPNTAKEIVGGMCRIDFDLGESAFLFLKHIELIRVAFLNDEVKLQSIIRDDVTGE